MALPYLGEIRLFAGNYAPRDWAFCDGSVLQIANNETLFQLIGTTYGGDGQETFALPDFRGRVPIHQGAGYSIGNIGGVEAVALTVSQIPSHRHLPQCASGAGVSASPGGNVWAASPNASATPYSGSAVSTTAMGSTMVASVGGSQAHENRIPFVAVNYIISLTGIFPST